MSFSTYALSKTWESAEDFPTYEDDESQVRADLQYLFSELEDDLNNHVSEEIAENISFPYSEDIPAYNVRGAIEELKGQLDAAVYETVMPDNSVTTAKLMDGAVATAKIADAGVATSKLADSAVTTAKIADANVTTAKFVDGAVTNEKVATATLTKDKIADGQVAKLTDGRIDPAVLPLAAAVVDSNKTLAATDNGYFLRITSAVTITVPVNGAVSLPVGFEVQLLSFSSGVVTLDMTGCSVYVANSSSAVSTYSMSKYEFVTLKKLSPQTSNIWAMTGSAFIPANKVSAAQITEGAVTSAKIADLNVTTGKINDSAVTTVKILDANVTTAKIADANITTAKIADANITTAKIADGAVTTAKIPNEAITTAKIDDAAITLAKLDSGIYGTSNPAMNGTASAGISTKLSKDDHVHPHDTYTTGLVLDATANIFNSVNNLPAAGTAGRIAFVKVG